jgi:hypothetical protein
VDVDVDADEALVLLHDLIVDLSLQFQNKEYIAGTYTQII